MFWRILVAVLVVLLLAVAYFRFTAVRISGIDARERVANGALLLDVRTTGEFEGGHIKGAINIPIQELPGRLDELGADTQEIVVYCASGGRSNLAKRLLEANGFDDVHDLGGIDDW